MEGKGRKRKKNNGRREEKVDQTVDFLCLGQAGRYPTFFWDRTATDVTAAFLLLPQFH
jgi:hypothetical protein